MLTMSLQVPPFWQGLEAHSFVFVMHVGPSKPLGQSQLNLPTRSRQVPPFLQGDEAHSLMLFSQCVPL